MYTTLISTTDLARELNHPDWAIIDCRFSLSDTTQGRQSYQASHIPNAQYAHLDDDLSGEIVPGKTGRHPLPEVDAFVEQLSKWGIDASVQVIAYDAAGGAIAARLWWLLRWLGHQNVAVLDGGWNQWRKENRPETKEVTARAPRQFAPNPCSHLIVDASVVEATLNQGSGPVWDARARDRFRGENETIDPVAGHIPGAICAPFTENLNADGLFKTQEQLRARFRSLLGGAESKDAICYCGSGVTACHNILGLLHAGLGEAKLYPGSWSEWITNPDRPIATGEVSAEEQRGNHE